MRLRNLLVDALDLLIAPPASHGLRDLQRIEGEVKRRVSLRLCFFSHYDPHGRIDPYVFHYLRGIRELGADLIFVSSAPNLNTDDLREVARLCRAVFRRPNLSYDFGSWNAALLGFPEWKDYEEIILANDSVYGPLYPLMESFNKMEAQGAEFWGMTDSEEIAPHLQSYFLVFRGKALSSGAFEGFWKRFRYYRSKRNIIWHYEIGITEAMKAAGVAARALVESASFRSLLLSREADFQYRDELEEGPLNLTLFFWGRLIEEARFPLVKTELFKLNRFDSKALRNWPNIVSEGGYDPKLVEGHVRRVAPHRAAVLSQKSV